MGDRGAYLQASAVPFDTKQSHLVLATEGCNVRNGYLGKQVAPIVVPAIIDSSTPTQNSHHSPEQHIINKTEHRSTQSYDYFPLELLVRKYDAVEAQNFPYAWELCTSVGSIVLACTTSGR